MRKFELVLFFDFIDAVLKIRKLSCSFQEKGNYFLKILSNLDISTIKVCMARKHSPRIPKERFRPAPAAAVVLNILSMTGNYFSISAVDGDGD